MEFSTPKNKIIKFNKYIFFIRKRLNKLFIFLKKLLLLI
jgi:hypothetical protein